MSQRCPRPGSPLLLPLLRAVDVPGGEEAVAALAVEPGGEEDGGGGEGPEVVILDCRRSGGESRRDVWPNILSHCHSSSS